MNDRKYKHRGYQDGGGYGSGNSSSSNSTPRPQTPRPEPRPQRLEGAPRGRTAGGFGPEAFKCNQCGQIRQGFSVDDIAFDELCLKCGADLHTCGNCRFFDTTTLWECRAEIKVRVTGSRRPISARSSHRRSSGSRRRQGRQAADSRRRAQSLRRPVQQEIGAQRAERR